ncbi:putative disease resistance protein RGA3 isoform X2 [Silene latifolia]
MAMGQLLKARAIDEMKLVWGLNDELEKLRDKFSELQPFLKDVGNAKHPDQRNQVNTWLQKVKDAAYFADDIMDDYDYEMLRRKLEQNKRFMKQFRSFFTRHNPVIFRVRMSHKVSDAIARFDDLERKAQSIGLKQVDITKDGIAGAWANDNGKSLNLSQARQLAAADATEFVGREDEMAKLLEIMCHPSSQEVNLSAIAIVGQGGLGKTTFARQLFESEKVHAHFQQRLWVSVPENFAILKILNDMVECVTSAKSNSPNIEASVKTLQEKLKKKKYLLVLDDVWCTNQELWSSLKNELKRIKGLPGSLILITTRNFDVARRSQASYTHPLDGLSDAKGWSLLKQKVFMGQTSPNISILEEIGRRIVEKCKGVPLAIKAIGGILQLKQHPHEWESVEQSDIWDLPQNDENQILPSLRVTFDHLPSPSLKQCFAYCAIFPKDCYIEKDELVDIWLAQGFLHEGESRSMTMEETGEYYLTVLQNYSLLQEAVLDEIPRFRMHDLVHDLAKDVSGEDVLLWKPKDNPKIDNCRHLVIDSEVFKALSEIPITMTLRKLRTVCGNLPPNVLAHAKYLRTLILDAQDLEEVPPSIGSLKHLRYLSLSYNLFSTLPDSIGKLYLLQTLRLLGCYYLDALPPVLYRLVNLVHIPTTDAMNASKGLVQLTNLQTLPHLALSGGDDDGGWSIDELGSLHKLRGEIHISGLELVESKEKARQAKFSEKAKISKITLAWAYEREESSGSYDVDVLDALQPHPNIICLELQNFFGLMLPSWMVRMSVVPVGGSSPSLLRNLTSFKLLNCSRCQMLPTLGYLPCLKYLVLSGLKVESIGDDFYGVPLNQSNSNVNPVSFQSLLELEISDFSSLKTWALPSSEVATTVFPLLEIITLEDCPELETIPALDFPSLKTLKLNNLGIQSFDITKHKSSFMSSPTSNLKLEILEISYCEKLVSLPSELQYVVSLKTIEVTDCPALASLPNDIFHGLTSLRELSICSCEALNNIPTSLEKCTSLETLTILDCPSIENHAPNFSKLKGLQELCKHGNSTTLMISMLKAVQHLPRLAKLVTGRFKDEVEQEMYFSHLSPNQHNQSIMSLTLQGHPNVKSLPEQLKLLNGLKVLVLLQFEDLEQLPEWMGYLSSLEELYFRECDKLQSLPSKEALSQLTQLRKLEIEDCPILAERCNKDNGPEWSKIARIPHIEIDYEEIN